MTAASYTQSGVPCSAASWVSWRGSKAMAGETLLVEVKTRRHDARLRPSSKMLKIP
jgi:hypothetical protein